MPPLGVSASFFFFRLFFALGFLAWNPHEVATNGRTMHLAQRGWVHQPGKVQEVVDLAGRLAAAIEPAFARLWQAAAREAAGVDPRGAASVDLPAGVMAGLEREVAAMRDVAATRAVVLRPRRTVAAVIFMVLGTGFVVAPAMFRFCASVR